MTQIFQRLFKSDVAWSFLSIGLRSGSSILILPLLLHKVSPQDLGLWYVFLSIGNFTNLLDFGFASTLTTATSYIWAGVNRLLPLGHAVENMDRDPNYPLLAQLVTVMRWYYRTIAAVVFFLMGTVGTWWILKKSGECSNPHQVGWVWGLFCLGIVVNTTGHLWPALLTGINGVRQSQQVLVLSLLTNLAISLVGLSLNLGLWALVTGQFVSGYLLRIGGRWCFYRRTGAHLPKNASVDFSLLKTLWPMAWRNGLASVGAFLIIQANTLVCSIYLPLEKIASYGLSLSVIMTAAAVSQAWVTVKMPYLGQLRAKGRYETILHVFVPCIRRFLVTYFLLVILLLLVGQPCLNLIGAKTSLLPKGPLVLLMITIGLEIHHAQYFSLLATGNRNPFVKPALLSGFGVVGLSVVLTPRFGITGLILSTLIVQALFNNWYVVYKGIESIHISASQYLLYLFRLNSKHASSHI